MSRCIVLIVRCDQWFKDNDNESNSQLVEGDDTRYVGCDQWFKDNDNESNSQLFVLPEGKIAEL